MDTNVTRDVGRLGEMLIGYKLEKAGFETSFVDRCGVDFWIRNPKGVITTLEVKTSSEPGNWGRGQLAYSFTVRDRSADYYAFVALDKEQFIVLGKDELCDYRVHRLTSKAFSEQREAAATRRLAGIEPQQLAA